MRMYEIPYCVIGTFEHTGLQNTPKSICKDRIIGTSKG